MISDIKVTTYFTDISNFYDYGKLSRETVEKNELFTLTNGFIILSHGYLDLLL